AAAAEMKSRIASSLSNLLSEQPDNDYIAEQISLMPNAQICTIDSFCSKLVKENFESLEIERDFKLLDSSDESILNEEALSCVLEKYYDEGSSAF
ncbi:UvrD-helicase domain-containing protein, partial [Acinetobacter baumannii]|nr:UvrD-helicase domain-containing protein [Acinetobacter baumannii]